MRSPGILLLATLGTMTACGLRFAPGWSMTNKDYFQEPPFVVVRGNTYALRWRYGAYGFFFQPSSKVRKGRLVFALQGTSSTGHLTGSMGELLISNPKDIAALNSNGPYWLEPDGQEVRLEVRHE